MATVGEGWRRMLSHDCVARPVIADLTADIRGIPTAMTFTNRSTQPQIVEARLVGDGNVQDTGWRTVTVPAKGAKSVAIAPKYTTLPATWSDLFVEIKRDGKLERNALRAGIARCGMAVLSCILPARPCRISGASSTSRERKMAQESYRWPNWMTNMPRRGNIACVSTHIAGMSRISRSASIRWRRAEKGRRFRAGGRPRSGLIDGDGKGLALFGTA